MLLGRFNKRLSGCHWVQWMHHYLLLECVIPCCCFSLLESLCSVGVVKRWINWVSLTKSWTAFLGAGSLWVCFICLFLYAKELTRVRRHAEFGCVSLRVTLVVLCWWKQSRRGSFCHDFQTPTPHLVRLMLKLEGTVSGNSSWQELLFRWRPGGSSHAAVSRWNRHNSLKLWGLNRSVMT